MMRDRYRIAFVGINGRAWHKNCRNEMHARATWAAHMNTARGRRGLQYLAFLVSPRGSWDWTVADQYVRPGHVG